MTAQNPISRKDSSMVSKSTYLIGYNLMQTIGWAAILFQIINYYLESNQKSLYKTVEWTLIIFQNIAVLEVVHSFLGITRSNPFVTLEQIFSRMMVVCGVLFLSVQSQNSVGVPLTLISWSITEIIRYGYYTLTLLGKVPYILLWLRYTTFIILYPLGVTGELLCTYYAQKEFRENEWFDIKLPNVLNFSFYYHYYLLFFMLVYIPFFPHLYLHMYSQRKKIIGGNNEDKKQI